MEKKFTVKIWKNVKLHFFSTMIKLNRRTNCFKNMCTEEFSWRPTVDGLSFESSRSRHLGWRDFGESEVYEVVKALNGDEAPGTNGSPWLFSRFVGKLLEMLEGVSGFPH